MTYVTAQGTAAAKRRQDQYAVREHSLDWLTTQGAMIETLIDDQDDPTPFQSQAWLSAWWRSFGADYDAFVLAVYCGDDVVAIFPLMRRKAAWLRELQWIGAGRSDHAPLLVGRDHVSKALGSLFEYLQGAQLRWDILSLRTLRESDVVRLQGSSSLGAMFAVEDVSPRIDIQGSWEHYLSTKSRKHRGNLARAIKRLESNPNVSVSCETEFGDLLLRELADVESNSWKRTGGSLRMSGEGFRFFESVMKGFSGRGLEVWVLRHRGEMLAYLVTFHYRRGIYYYNGAYREEAKSRVSEIPVGTTLLSLAVKSAHDRGLTFFDFLRGDEAYKDLWANSRPRLFHMVLRRKSLRGLVVEGVSVRLRWWLRGNVWARKAWAYAATLRGRFATMGRNIDEQRN